MTWASLFDLQQPFQLDARSHPLVMTVVKGSTSVPKETVREAKKKTSRIKPILLWIRQVVRWSIGGLLVLSLLVSPAIFVLPVYFDLKVFECAEQHLRAAGLLFQIAGFLLVAVNFNRVLRLFQKPSVFAQISSYFKISPRFVQSTILLALSH